MKYIDIDGIRLSRMTLGTVQLGLQYGIANKSGKPTLEKSFEILKTAEDGGVNSFDTASQYGDSENVLGNYFKKIGTEAKTITTKFKVEADEKTDKKEIEKQIRGFAEQSLARLGISKIPVYMLHRADDMWKYGDVVPETLKKLKNEGIIGKAGVSCYKTEEIAMAVENDVYEAVQIPMNILDNRLIKSGSIDRLKKKGFIVFVRSVFLQGLFFMKQEELPSNLSGVWKHLLNLRGMAEREGMSVEQLALSYIRDLDGISSLVIGVETPEQVRANVKLMNGPAVSEKTREEAYRLFDGIEEKILNPVLWK
jgi:Predicted oxidoreductases (related to aryl-alcohol dehydrogenases)